MQVPLNPLCKFSNFATFGIPHPAASNPSPSSATMASAKVANALGAPATTKQPSRKGKKAWRKNVDVFDVEEGLETVRDEITKG